jgi:hypothetical protein
MPTVLRVGAIRFFFFSNEGNEPPHIHVERGEAYAKDWLAPEVRMEYSVRFRDRDRTKILRLIERHQEQFLEKWNEYFEGET